MIYVWFTRLRLLRFAVPRSPFTRLRLPVCLRYTILRLFGYTRLVVRLVWVILVGLFATTLFTFTFGWLGFTPFYILRLVGCGWLRLVTVIFAVLPFGYVWLRLPRLFTRLRLRCYVTLVYSLRSGYGYTPFTRVTFVCYICVHFTVYVVVVTLLVG